MRRKSGMKVSRGRLEEERRKSDEKFMYQRVLLVMLPIIMVAVLVVGAYFGYLSFMSDFVEIKDDETPVVYASEAEFTEEEERYLLTVVSSANTVDASFKPKLVKYKGIEVSYLIKDSLDRMLTDAQAQELDVNLISGYISYEEQKEIYDTAVSSYKKKKKCSIVKAEAAVKKTTPNAGESEQQTGLVVELSCDEGKKFKDTAEFRWLSKNCVDYGFILRYPDKENTGGIGFSPNLFRYVGEEHAYRMRAYDMNLDEYVQYLGIQ